MAQGFYQRRAELITTVLNSVGLTATEKCIVMTLLHDYMNAGHEMAWMSVPTLAKRCGLRPETVRRALKKSVKLKYLARAYRAGKTMIYWMGETWRAAGDPGPGDP